MKKQPFFLSTLIIVFALFVATGCQKDTEAPPPAKTKTELITSGSWSFDKAMAGGTDISASVNACYKDNVVRFTSATNGTVTSTVACTPTDITPATFTWSWQSSETILALNAPLFPGGTGNFNLISLSETALVVEQTVNFGIPTSVTFHYKH